MLLMYAFKLLSIPLFLILFSSFLFSTTYENASNKKTTKWHVLERFSKGVIKNIYDKKKKSRVIKLSGNATKSVYILMPKKKSFQRKKGEDLFQWEMNYHEDFVIMIGMNTLKGKRYLIYTSGDKDSYLQYGLGADSTSGQWKQYARNLQEDLEYSDKYNKIININSFVIKGSGMVDNIKMVKSKHSIHQHSLPRVLKEMKEKIPTVEKKVEKKVEKQILKHPKVKKSTQPPIIYLKGENPLVLKKGERYIEPGVTAKNRDGSPVDVMISEDIDIFKDGEYSVIYMATNSAGHSAVDRRRVRVGTVIEEKEDSAMSESLDDRNSEEPLEIEEDAVDLEQRALEILDWEKQLASREQELDREKDFGGVSHPNVHYPSRPGL